ncbi:MAG: hypothetical protein Tsb009_35630 [Planctomycetaceae bacterium]
MNSYSKKSGNIVRGKMGTFKGWLTTIGRSTFFCLEDLSQIDEKKSPSRLKYIVGRVQRVGDVLLIRLLNSGNKAVSNAKTREALENVLRFNTDDNKLYMSTLTYRKQSTSSKSFQKILSVCL